VEVATVHAESEAHDKAGGLWQLIRRDAFLLTLSNLIIVAVQIGFRGILLADLSPSSYGRLSLVLSIYNSAWIIGSSGLPNSVARFIAIAGKGDDTPIVVAALRAAAVPLLLAAVGTGVVSGAVLHSPAAAIFGAIGVTGLLLSLVAMGILRGRHRTGLAALILPIAASVELASVLALPALSGGLTEELAFTAFTLGNIAGCGAGIFLVMRTNTRTARPRHQPPSAKSLLGFSLWVALATGAVSILPLAVRLAASLDSYATVALADVALVLFSVPQRLGSIIVLAVTPHASKQLAGGRGRVRLDLSARDHLVVFAPFALMAAIVWATPLMDQVFATLGKPEYAGSAPYLALALLAAGPRILYGMAEGLLVAHGAGRFLATSAAGVAGVATLLAFASVALGSPIGAFWVFAAASWATYGLALRKVRALGRNP
jgi:O-antigen/teichoic acid export membrane protein